MSNSLMPHFNDVQAHYDLSDEFFQLFLDPSQTYSCAYFERDDMTLEQAQAAKVDLSLSKLDLRPGMTLLDVGCGWGATLMRAVENYDVDVVGLTLSRNQQAHVEKLFANSCSPRDKRVVLEGWEKFDEQVDRIVSIGAFEHFGKDRWDDFFHFAYSALPDDGAAVGGRSGAPRRQGRFQHRPRAVAAAALRQDPGPVGRGIAGAPRRGDLRAVRRGLRPVHEVPDRLPVLLRRRVHRREPGDVREAGSCLTTIRRRRSR